MKQPVRCFRWFAHAAAAPTAAMSVRPGSMHLPLLLAPAANDAGTAAAAPHNDRSSQALVTRRLLSITWVCLAIACFSGFFVVCLFH